MGISLTVLLWSDGIQTIPIRFMIYEKDKHGKALKTKNDFALEALQYAYALGIRPSKVTFDSKYASKRLLNWLNDNGLIYFSQLACNRSFKGKQLKMRRFQPYPEVGKLKGVRHRVCIAKYRKRYYVTNVTEKRITTKQIVSEYRVRWKIEVLFRTLKQLCHLEECQSYKTETQKHYVFVCLKAFLKLDEMQERSYYVAKNNFQQKMIGFKINGNKALRQMTT